VVRVMGSKHLCREVRPETKLTNMAGLRRDFSKLYNVQAVDKHRRDIPRASKYQAILALHREGIGNGCPEYLTAKYL
jgi:hypothetical protein